MVKVDPNLPLEQLGPLGCGVQTGAGSVLVALDVQPGSSLVIFGAGAVGLSAVMAAVVAEASTIIAVDLQRHRLDLATELGATHVIDGADADIVEQIQTITGGGANYAFDTTGVPAVIVSALASLRMAGVCGLVGAQTGDLVLDGLATIGKSILGILGGGVDPQRVRLGESIHRVAQRPDPDPVGLRCVRELWPPSRRRNVSHQESGPLMAERERRARRCSFGEAEELGHRNLTALRPVKRVSSAAFS